MGVIRFASLLAAASVAFGGYAAYRRSHGAMARDRTGRQPEPPLQRWEGEGGAVPALKRAGPATAGRSDDLLDPGGDSAVAAGTAAPRADASH